MKITSLSQLIRNLKALGIAFSVSHKLEESKSISGFCVDSRLVQPEQVFFALPGERTDGHLHLGEVASRGASAAVVRNDYNGPEYNLDVIRVEDTLEVLQELARHQLKSHCAKIIAITGSVGKTTTKEFLVTLLRTTFRVGCNPGNANTKISLPLVILNEIRGDEDFLVLEMGMTGAGQITRLMQIASPDIALLTHVALVHAENFSSLKQIAYAKGEVFSHSKTTLGILPSHLEHFKELSAIGDCSKISYSSVSDQADYVLRVLGKQLCIRSSEGEVLLPSLEIPGAHNIHNFLAASVTAKSVGVSWDSIREAIPLLKLPERRLEYIERNGVLFVNDAYNASPISVKAALSSLPTPKEGGRVIAVLGEMLELGWCSETGHREVAEDALDKVDLMFCLGESCFPIYQSWGRQGRFVAWFLTREDLVRELRKHIRSGDVILLKGSRSKSLWKVLEEL